MDGQRYLSAIVDLAFFGVVLAFGLRHVLSEAVLATLLSAYAAHRFGVAMGKQQAVIALSGGSGPSSGGGGTSTSGEHRLTTTTATTDSVQAPGPRSKIDPRTLQQAVAAVVAKVGWIG